MRVADEQAAVGVELEPERPATGVGDLVDRGPAVPSWRTRQIVPSSVPV